MARKPKTETPAPAGQETPAKPDTSERARAFAMGQTKKEDDDGEK